MPATGFAWDTIVKIDGTALSREIANDLIEVRVTRTVIGASRCEIVIIDEFFNLVDAETFAIGKAVEVAFVHGEAAPVTTFKGEIAARGVEQRGTHRHLLVIEALDKVHRLGHTSRVKVYLDQKFSDMISTLAGTYGLTADVVSSISNVTHKYYMQDCSDAEFLDEIALRTGCEWFVDDGKLKVRPRPATAAAKTYNMGEDIYAFSARYSGVGHVATTEVGGWDPASKQAIVGSEASLTGTPTGGSDATFASGGSTKSKTMNGNDAKFRSSALPVTSVDEANEVAKSLANRETLNELIVRCEIGFDPTLHAGERVAIGNVGTSLAGEYYVSEVEHRITPYRESTRFIAGPRESTELVALLGPKGRAVGRFSRTGLVVGLVTNNTDDDANLNRVKVKFPAFDDTVESAWARVVTVGGGLNTGFMVIPQVNDEVLVGFEHGDPRRPYVLGGLYNATDTPPQLHSALDTTKDGKTNRWHVKTPKGNVLEIVDTDTADDRGVTITATDTKTTLHLLNSKIEVLSNKKPIEIKDTDGGSIILDGAGKITIEGKEVMIKSTSGNVTIQSAASLELKGSSGGVFDGGPKLELKASATLDVKSGGMLNLKGSMTKIN